MQHPVRFQLRLVFWSSLAALGLAQGALADDHRRVPLLPAYQQECAACHLPYPPGMLPTASWRRLMTNLPRHFGTDASLDPASLKELSTWLAANAGTYNQCSWQGCSAGIGCRSNYSSSVSQPFNDDKIAGG